MGLILDPAVLLLELGIAASPTDMERAIAHTATVRAEGAVKRYLRYDPLSRSRTEYYPQMDLSRTTRQGVWESSDTQAYIRQLSEAATDELQVRHLPIRSSPAMQLWIDYDGRAGARSGSFAASTLQTEGTDYWANYDQDDSSGNRACRDGIIRSVGAWPSTPGSVKVTYTAGYTLAELTGQDSVIDASPIWGAVMEEAARRFRKARLLAKKTGVGFVAGPLVSEKLGDYSYTVDAALANRMYGGVSDLLPESCQKLEPFVNWGVELAS